MDRWTDRLSEYIDGDLAEPDRAALEAHLAACDGCNAVLGDLRRIVAGAGALIDTPPAHDLWPAIHDRIEGAPAAGVIPLRRRAAGLRRTRVSFSVPQLVAAALALSLLSGAAVWFALGGGAPGPVDPALARAGLTGTTYEDVHFTATRAAYGDVIADLERSLAQNRQYLDPVTIGVIETNLRLIDSAIRDARAALRADPGNDFINEHLDATLMKKIDLLRHANDVVRAET